MIRTRRTALAQCGYRFFPSRQTRNAFARRSCSNNKRRQPGRARGGLMGNFIGRKAIAIIAIALASGLVSAVPPFSLVHGWSIDVLTALRWQAFGARHDPV